MLPEIQSNAVNKIVIDSPNTQARACYSLLYLFAVVKVIGGAIILHQRYFKPQTLH